MEDPNDKRVFSFVADHDKSRSTVNPANLNEDAGRYNRKGLTPAHLLIYLLYSQRPVWHSIGDNPAIVATCSNVNEVSFSIRLTCFMPASLPVVRGHERHLSVMVTSSSDTRSHAICKLVKGSILRFLRVRQALVCSERYL